MTYDDLALIPTRQPSAHCVWSSFHAFHCEDQVPHNQLRREAELEVR